MMHNGYLTQTTEKRLMILNLLGHYTACAEQILFTHLRGR
jgi:hypothetical protein